jgi:hypothetical protein
MNVPEINYSSLVIVVPVNKSSDDAFVRIQYDFNREGGHAMERGRQAIRQASKSVTKR